MVSKNRPLLGAHVSVAGGYVNGITKGEEIGAECIMIFGASPRSYTASLPSVESVAVFKKRLKESSIKSVCQHGAYLPNLGTADPDAMRKSIANLSAHLQIANLIGSSGVIFHVGSPNGGELKDALERAAAAMKEVLKRVDAVGSSSGSGRAQLIMENSGSVKKIGGRISDLEFLFKKVGDSRVKVCVDTAHSFEAGLIESYTPANITKFLNEWDSAVGLENIPALHINDSKTEYNSQNDKHENLGEGFIGLSGFRALARHVGQARESRLSHTSWFLEVPGFDEMGPDKRNMDILKSCFNSEF